MWLQKCHHPTVEAFPEAGTAAVSIAAGY